MSRSLLALFLALAMPAHSEPLDNPYDLSRLSSGAPTQMRSTTPPYGQSLFPVAARGRSLGN
jgi:hypothetical protein